MGEKTVVLHLNISFNLNQRIHLYKLAYDKTSREDAVLCLLEEALKEKLNRVIIRDGEIQK